MALCNTRIWELEEKLAKRSGRKGRTTELDRELNEAEESDTLATLSKGSEPLLGVSDAVEESTDTLS